MRVVVIGGTRFMGREIVGRLVANGHDVSVPHRRDQHDLGPDVQNLQADRADLTKVLNLLTRGRFEAVFDLAYDWQHGTTADQVEAAARGCGDQLQRYIFMSSVAAYDPGIDHRETDPLVPDDVPNPYAQHKASAERRLFGLPAEVFPVTTIRPVFVHGPRQPFSREKCFWDRLLDGRPIVLPDAGFVPRATIESAGGQLVGGEPVFRRVPRFAPSCGQRRQSPLTAGHRPHVSGENGGLTPIHRPQSTNPPSIHHSDRKRRIAGAGGTGVISQA
jgi:nucleoside-diphosphate-sugar epimerase